MAEIWRISIRPRSPVSDSEERPRCNSGRTPLDLHNLRHSLSNWLVNKAKQNPKTVQRILGHSRVQTTLDL